MKNKISILTISSLILILAGCVNPQTVTKTQLDKEKSEWNEPKVSIWYYIGSKDGFHYYLHRDLPEDQIYRISESELRQENQFPITRSQRKWEVMPWGVHAIK